jgi:hypothetical protein
VAVTHVLSLKLNAKSSQYFSSPETCAAQGSTVEIQDHPFSFQSDAQECGTAFHAALHSARRA